MVLLTFMLQGGDVYGVWDMSTREREVATKFVKLIQAHSQRYTFIEIFFIEYKAMGDAVAFQLISYLLALMGFHKILLRSNF